LEQEAHYNRANHLHQPACASPHVFTAVNVLGNCSALQTGEVHRETWCIIDRHSCTGLSFGEVISSAFKHKKKRKTKKTKKALATVPIVVTLQLWGKLPGLKLKAPTQGSNSRLWPACLPALD
jgi:hypothetical protein